MSHAPVGSRTSSYGGGYVGGYRGSLVSGTHAPVGTGECSMLNGHTYTRTQGDTTCAYWVVPASFEHAEKMEDVAFDQYKEGVDKVGNGIDTITGDHKIWDGIKQIFAGWGTMQESTDTYHAASGEMMEAARDQAQQNRGSSPDAMNHVESHSQDICIIA